MQFEVISAYLWLSCDDYDKIDNVDLLYQVLAA